MIDSLKEERIALEVIKVLKTHFDDLPEDVTERINSPFHQNFLDAFESKFNGKVQAPFFINLDYQPPKLDDDEDNTDKENFFEHVAHILCDGEKKEFTTRRSATPKISPSQKRAVSTIITELSNGVRTPDVDAENELIFGGGDDDVIPATDFTADVFYEDEGQVVCIELKTVRPNKATFKGEKDKILEAKAALRNLYPNKEIKYYVGFPFDPLSREPTGYDKERFMRYSVDFRKYIARDEFLLAAELWDFLTTNAGTMELILEIINSIATVDFLENFEFLQSRRNLETQPVEYLALLAKWRLGREQRIAGNRSTIEARLQSDRSGVRVYNQSIFTESGKYNEARLARLQQFV